MAKTVTKTSEAPRLTEKQVAKAMAVITKGKIPVAKVAEDLGVTASTIYYHMRRNSVSAPNARN